MQNRLFELAILGVWICVAVVVYVQNSFIKTGAPIISRSIEAAIESENRVSKVEIVNSNLFKVTLCNGSFVMGRLDVQPSPDSYAKIKSLLNSSKTSLIQKQKDGVWLLRVDLFLDGKRTNLGNWLRSNNLVSIK